MVLSDFLSRQKDNNSNPHEIIPIFFNIYKMLADNYYNVEKYLVQTRSQVKSSGIKLSEVHGVGKNLDPNIKPEKQHANSKKGSIEKPCIGKGRARSRRKRPDPIHQTINQPSDLSQEIPRKTKKEMGKTNLVHSRDPMHSINNANGRMTDSKSLIPDVPFHPGPVYRPPPKPIKPAVSNQQSSQSSPGIEDITPNTNLYCEEISPFQEGVLSETFHRPDKSFFSRA